MKSLKTESIIIIAFIVITLISFLTGTITINGGGKDGVRVDTTYITKTITLPAIIDTFYIDKPVAVMVYDSDKEAEYLALKTENERLKKYLEDTKVRIYENKYNSKDSLVSVKTIDSVSGTLLSQKVEFNIKERDIEYTEKIINKTITKKPVFSLSTGFSIKTSNYNLNSSAIELNVGLRNRSGFEIDFGYDTAKNIRVGLKKDILTIYK